jgi:CRP-like cAMP-binding protein
VADRRVALLRVDPELRACVPPNERALAERVALAPVVHVPEGTWRLDDEATAPTLALILDGLLTRDLEVAGYPTAHVHGPGDILRPWLAADPVLPHSSRWTAGKGGATLAVLDERFDAAAQRWSKLGAAISQRLAGQADAACLRTAITALPRVEQRVLALLWHLAERWGAVTADGVVLNLHMTHDVIGRLVGAKRPTVSLALTALAAEGAVVPIEIGGWRLDPDALESLSTAPAAGPATVPRIVHRTQPSWRRSRA